MYVCLHIANAACVVYITLERYFGIKIVMAFKHSGSKQESQELVYSDQIETQFKMFSKEKKKTGTNRIHNDHEVTTNNTAQTSSVIAQSQS